MAADRVADGVRWWRPLLGVRRATTRQACADQDLPVWDDPWNTDPRFPRVRLRTEVLPLLENVLAGGVAAALARTAEQLREDLDVLDEQAADLLAAALESSGASSSAGLDVAVLAQAPAALRRRVLRRWLLGAGVVELTDAHLRAADNLIGRWSGQGALRLPGALELVRVQGRLHVSR
jgi:tRNA(Ile)-lysidine synthase